MIRITVGLIIFILLYLLAPTSTAQGFVPRDTLDKSTQSSDSTSGSSDATRKWLEDAFRQQDSGTSAAGLWLESKGISIEGVIPPTSSNGDKQTGEWIPKDSVSNDTNSKSSSINNDQDWIKEYSDDTLSQSQGMDTVKDEESLFSVPQWVKEEEVKNVGNESPFYEEVTAETSHTEAPYTYSYSDPVAKEPITDLMPPQWRKYRDWAIVEGVKKIVDNVGLIPIIGEPVKKLWEKIYDKHIRPAANRQEWEERHGREHTFAP